MKFRVKYFLIFSIIIVFCSFVLSYGTLSQPETENQTINISPSNEDIISLYEELISLRLNALEQKKSLYEYGLGVTSDLAEAEANLSEARIQLAEFQGKNELVIKELYTLEQLLTDIRNRQKREVDIGQRPMDTLVDIDVRLIETKIRIAKIKLEQNDVTVTSDYQSKSQLQMRLDIANKINNIQMKNDTLARIAAIAARSGQIDIMKEILGQINNIQLKNQTARACAIQLIHAMKTEEALEIVHMINDLKMKNEIFMQMATMDYEWTN